MAFRSGSPEIHARLFRSTVVASLASGRSPTWQPPRQLPVERQSRSDGSDDGTAALCLVLAGCGFLRPACGCREVPCWFVTRQ
jgi:hypothetical protein